MNRFSILMYEIIFNEIAYEYEKTVAISALLFNMFFFNFICSKRWNSRMALFTLLIVGNVFVILHCSN